jgi:hypothetical protein
MSIDYGTVTVGEYADTSFYVTNTGGDTLTGTVVIDCENFSIQAGEGPYSLARDETLFVTVRYQPNTTGNHECTIADVCSDVYCQGIGGPPPVCWVDPTTLDFGTVPAGVIRDTTFTIENIGGGTLSGNVSESCTDFSLEGPTSYSLGTGQSKEFTVRFEPVAAGSTYCMIETGEAGCSDVYCTGYVDTIAPLSPSGFNVTYNAGFGNQLTWNSSEAEDFDHFNIYRSDNPNLELPPPVDTVLAVVHSTPDTSWMDGATDGWRYRYRLTAVDSVGNESDQAYPETETGVGDSEIPGVYALHQNVPNPFNPVTRIRYDVPASGGMVTIRIYDVEGRLVCTLVNEYQSPGQKVAIWHGRNSYGQSVTTGVYFYRMTALGFEMTRKMVLLK